MMTLKKISHLTGYSVSTVSKALNDKHDINEDTKKIIQEFALKTNYVPNKNAIALRRNKSNIIAVILPKVNDTFYSDTLFNIQNLACSFGFRVMLFQTNENSFKENEYLVEINDGSVAGAIVLSTNNNELYNRKFNAIPIKYIQIVKNQSNDILKAICLSYFENLLQKIN